MVTAGPGGLIAGGFEAAPLPLDPRAEASSFSTDDVPLDIGVLQAMARQVSREVPVVSDAAGQRRGLARRRRRASRRAVHDVTGL